MTNNQEPVHAARPEVVAGWITGASRVISALLIGLLGYYLTKTHDQHQRDQQNHIAQIQTFEHFLPYLTGCSSSPESKRFAILGIRLLDLDLALRVALVLSATRSEADEKLAQDTVAGITRKLIETSDTNKGPLEQAQNVWTTLIADAIERRLEENLSAYESEKKDKAAALVTFRELWESLQKQCSDRKTGDAGTRTISERQQNGSKDWFKLYRYPIEEGQSASPPKPKP